MRISKMLLYWLVVVLLCAATVKVESTTIIERPKADDSTQWWENATIYQIYPRSFKDSNNDGVGDFQGIIEKLNHLKDAGVTVIWFPPIYQSRKPPQVDFGYETIDYINIDEEYEISKGDFKKLINQANKLGIKVIIEIVPNHSSNEHEWFLQSKIEDEQYKNYYVWRDGKDGGPPNNWISHFNEPAWTYDEERKQWYLHQFSAEQPDLNYYDDGVREEMKNVLNSWLKLGVDGFLIGDVPYLMEHEDYPDEPLSGNGVEGDYESLTHIYTSNQEETYDLIAEWRQVIDEYNDKNSRKDPRIIITKAHTEIDKAMLYCGTADRRGAHFTYNFLLTTELKNLKAQTIYNIIEKWRTNMPAACVENWVLGNHDLHRVASRFDSKLVDGLNALLAFLPGVMITYNGEEIGQENGHVSFEDTRDPLACEAGEENYNKITRDFERTPFQWDDSNNAGFNTDEENTPWLPVGENYQKNNLKDQSRPGYTSHYHTYQALTKLRQESGFTKATKLACKVLSENVIVILKEVVEGKVYAFLINTSDEEETVDLSEISELLPKYLRVVIANSDSKKHNRVLPTNNIVLDAYESIIVKGKNVEEGDADWWKHAVVYQIYPLSFKDSNNDGFGDIKGIISKLDHLKDAGITAAWLTPIYKSPQVDQGYDISDFKDIDERFGTLADFDKLVVKAHELGIKIIMDFVPNHSSNKHEWFVKSEKEESEFKDFYVWADGKGEDPPSNWLSLFKGSAWTYSATRGQWYLHQFAAEQPDLNYRNPVVVQNMKDILEFWLDKRVDGFRMDAVPYIFEDKELTDEDSSNDPNSEVGVDHGSLIHAHTSDLPETFDMIYQWREFVDDYSKEHGGDARILMTEAYTDIENTMKYYGNDVRDGAHFTFNFQLITKLEAGANARDVSAAIDEWLTYMPKRYVANWVLGNHDNHRVASRFGPKNVDGFNMVIGLLPGVMVTYNGEEIGQENGEVTWDEGRDPSACNGEQEAFERTTRDLERTPFHWDVTANAGFNEGNKTWLPVSRKHPKLNLAAQNIPEKQSHYNVYKKLVQIRSMPVVKEGSLQVEAVSDNVLMIIRSLEEGDTYVLFFNVGNKIETIQISKIINTVTPYVEIVLMSSGSLHRIGNLIPTDKLTLNAHESIIVATTSDTPTTPNPGGGGGGAAEITISFVVFAVVCCMHPVISIIFS